jgi:hypothetical protein
MSAILHHRFGTTPKRSTISQMWDKELGIIDLTHHYRNMPSHEHRANHSTLLIKHTTEVIHLLANAKQRTQCPDHAHR